MGTQLPEAHGSDEGVVGECTGKTEKKCTGFEGVCRDAGEETGWTSPGIG